MLANFPCFTQGLFSLFIHPATLECLFILGVCQQTGCAAGSWPAHWQLVNYAASLSESKDCVWRIMLLACIVVLAQKKVSSIISITTHL